MSLASRFAAVSLLVPFVALAACSSDDSPATTQDSDTQTFDTGTTDTGAPPSDTGSVDTGSDTASDAPAVDTKVHVRIAHLSPDAPAVDVCVKPKGTATFVGPVLKGSGLAFPQITKYLELPPGEYTARLVAAGATSCDTSLASLPDYDLPKLEAGTWATAAALGEVGSTPATFTVKPFVDSHGAPASGKIAIRFVHASPNTPAVDVGVGEGSAFTKVWGNVAFQSFGAATGADANGFLTTDPLSSVAVVARAAGSSTDALVIKPVSAPAGAIVSAWAIGLFGTTSGDKRLSVLVCVDSADPTGGLTTCNRLP